MRLFTRSVFAGVVASVAGASANAGLFDQNIYLTFSDPVGQREVRYTQPADATQQGNITYNTSIPLNLSFDLSDFGLGGLVIESNLALDIDVGPASVGVQPNEYLATSSGSFEFRRESDDALLISGSFIQASLSILRTSGGLTANGLMQSLQFSMTFHGDLLTEFTNFGYAFAGFDTERVGDASWTLTGVSPSISLITPPGSAEQFFANFTSNAAFTATVPVLPTPGSVTLGIAAGVLMFGGRRRNA
jgi:hypothetical protein